MAVAFVASTTNSQGNSAGNMTTGFDPGAVGANGLIVAMFNHYADAGPVDTATWDGNNMTLLTSQSGSDQVYTYIYYYKAPTASVSKNLVIGSARYSELSISSYSGVSQSAPFGTVDKTSGVNGSGAKTRTVSSTTDDMVIAIMGFRDSDNPSLSNGTGQTQIMNERSPDGITEAIAAYKAGGSPSTTMEFTISGDLPDYWTMIAAPILVAPSTFIKTINGNAYASTKTIDGLAIASVKSINGLT